MPALPLPEEEILQIIKRGAAIPAHPLALNRHRKPDECHQRALTRYYLDAGAGGIAVGVHTTQFEIREPKIGLFQPVLELAMEEIKNFTAAKQKPIIKIAGVVGRTSQALEEAKIAVDLGYDAALLSLSAYNRDKNDAIIQHCKAIAEIIPLWGFYLQPAAGGRTLNVEFWRRFAEIENLVAIKIAPFNRYQTLDVLRGVAESGRASEIALYTGNDDNIIMDLITPFRLSVDNRIVELKIVGGLLGHWAVWTKKAVELFEQIQNLLAENSDIPKEILELAPRITDCNAAIFDVAHNFAGCIVGIHEILHRQGLMQGIWTLNPNDQLSETQKQEIDRVYNCYPDLNDDQFVEKNLHLWLK